MNLAEIDCEQVTQVKEIKSSSLRVRLFEMGLFEGVELEVLYKAPFNGPIAVKIGSYTLALRIDEAKEVIVNVI